MGFNDPCFLKKNCDLTNNEICLFKVCETAGCRIGSETGRVDSSHIADCNTPNFPFANTFTKQVCCKSEPIAPTPENCADGVDNNGNGFIDCADPECHPRTYVDPLSGDFVSQSPQQCDPDPIPGNFQTASNCVIGYDPSTFEPIFNDSCVGPDSENPEMFPVVNQSFYCSYGFNDDSSIPPGFCCPAGTYYDFVFMECSPFQVCGLGSDFFCIFNFFNQQFEWLNSFYDGSYNWCQSYLPNIRTVLGVSSSEACCPVFAMGTFGFYIVDENVKIFGAE
ncbi:MAG: hypothetical protein K0B15_05365 [Lentimicrobium sp.]|nr:hypothetical protein [Lentimicrobium sp.]